MAILFFKSILISKSSGREIDRGIFLMSLDDIGFILVLLICNRIKVQAAPTYQQNSPGQKLLIFI